MTPELFLVLVGAAYLIGGAASIYVPYLRKKLEGTAENFEWRKATGRALFVVMGALPTLLGAAQVAEFKALADQGWYGVGLALLSGLIAFGASSLGHQTQSAPKAVRAYRANGKGDA